MRISRLVEVLMSASTGKMPFRGVAAIRAGTHGGSITKYYVAYRGLKVIHERVNG